MKFLARSAIVLLTVLLAFSMVYASLFIIATVNLDIGQSADMGLVKYTRASVFIGKLEIGGLTYNLDIYSVDNVIQKYKTALMKADLFTPEILKFASFAKQAS